MNLIGEWILLEHSQINEDLRGKLVYSSDMNMSVHITGKFNGVDIFISYSGTYFIEENFIIHKVEISENPKRVGAELRRYLKLNGDLMTFTESPHDSSFRVVWQKQESLSSSL